MQALRRILLVEDDPELPAEIADFLASEGYQIDRGLTGDEGLRLGQINSYAVMLIDRMLPGLDGLSVIQRLRNEGNDAPALIVSALGEVDERVRGLATII
jgi:two-component system, OmpR family, response regulator